MHRYITLSLTTFLGLASMGCFGFDMMTMTPPGEEEPVLLCGGLGYDEDAQKIEAFIDTGARFEAEALALAAEVEATCGDIATDLGVEIPSALEGELQVQATCGAVATEIEAIVDAAIPTGSTLTIEHEPAVCTFDVDAYAVCVADCDASFDAEASPGSASASGDAQCSATCEASATIVAECTEPSVTVTYETDVSPEAAARLELLALTLERYYPHFLSLAARVEGAAFTGSELVTSFEGAADAAGRVGFRASACFADSTLGALRSMATLEVTLSVSIEVSASASATAG